MQVETISTFTLGRRSSPELARAHGPESCSRSYHAQHSRYTIAPVHRVSLGAMEVLCYKPAVCYILRNMPHRCIGNSNNRRTVLANEPRGCQSTILILPFRCWKGPTRYAIVARD